MVGGCGKNEGPPSTLAPNRLQTSQWKEVSWWSKEEVERCAVGRLEEI